MANATAAADSSSASSSTSGRSKVYDSATDTALTAHKTGDDDRTSDKVTRPWSHGGNVAQVMAATALGQLDYSVTGVPVEGKLARIRKGDGHSKRKDMVNTATATAFSTALVDLNLVNLEVLKAHPSTMLAKFAPHGTSLNSSSGGSSSEAVAKPRASELTRVFNIVNEAKESGITLEAAGGAAVLPVLDALVKDGRVRRVFDMMQVRWVDTNLSELWDIQPLQQHQQRKQQLHPALAATAAA
eukprot:1724-Heterococcus_DN1.PRE.1